MHYVLLWLLLAVFLLVPGVPASARLGALIFLLLTMFVMRESPLSRWLAEQARQPSLEGRLCSVLMRFLIPLYLGLLLALVLWMHHLENGPFSPRR